MKLSEVTYEYLESVGLGNTYIHTDCSDVMRCIPNAFHWEHAKKEIAEKYGDVELIITPGAVWHSQIVIDDDKWRKDNRAYCAEKAAWCAKYGCD